MLTFLFLLYQYINAKMISQKFNFYNDRPILHLSYLIDNSLATPFVNTYHSYSLIENKQIETYNKNNLQTTKKINLETELPVLDTKEEIMFNDIKMSFKQYILTGHSWYPDQGVGLGFKFKDEDYSFIHQLYKKKHIELLLYAIHFDDSKYGGSVYFGGLPGDINEYNKYKGNCNADENFSSWGCNVTHIKINNINITMNNYSIFHSTFYGLFYSDTLFKVLSDALSEQINDHTCGVYNEGKTVKTFMMCDRNFIHNSNITFEITFNDMIVSLPIAKLFEKSASKDRSSSLIYNNPSIYYSKYDIIFGGHFFKLFNYTVFDYDNKKIGLYSDSISIQMTNTHSVKGIKIWYIVTSVILLLFISYMIIIIEVNK